MTVRIFFLDHLCFVCWSCSSLSLSASRVVSLVIDKSLQQVQCETCQQPSCRIQKGRMGAFRRVRCHVDLWVVVAYMWPEPSCVSDRERNRRLWLYLDCINSNMPGRPIPLLSLGANGHTGLQMVQPKVLAPCFR